MNIWCSRHDRLGAGDDDAFCVALNDVDVHILIELLIGTLAAIALGICHRDTERHIFVLNLLQIDGEPSAVLGGTLRVIHLGHCLQDAIEGIVRQVALSAAGFLAEHADRFQLVQQVTGRFVDVQHAIDRLAGSRLLRQHQRCKGRVVRKVVGHCQGVDARLKRRCVSNRGDRLTIDIDSWFVLSQ